MHVEHGGGELDPRRKGEKAGRRVWWEALPALLERELAARGWSMAALARRTGTSLSLIQQVMRREHPPSLRMVVRIAKALGYEPVELFALTVGAQPTDSPYPRLPVHPELTGVVTIAAQDSRLRELLRLIAHAFRGDEPDTSLAAQAAEGTQDADETDEGGEDERRRQAAP